MDRKVFTTCIKVTGKKQSSYVFTSERHVQDWMCNSLPRLEKKYGSLIVSKSKLAGLKVGDKCRVWGEAGDIFVIQDIKRYSEDRYAFGLDSGWWEEVAKCYAVD